MINSLHMATLRELEDPLANEVDDATSTMPDPRRRDRSWSRPNPWSPKTALTPTDYAQAWALTHYLALKRGGDFVRYLKAMSQMPPLEPRTPEEHLAEFRKFFGDDLVKIDKEADKHIRKLSQTRTIRPAPLLRGDFRAAAGRRDGPPRGLDQPIAPDDRAMGGADDFTQGGIRQLASLLLSDENPGHLRRRAMDERQSVIPIAGIRAAHRSFTSPPTDVGLVRSARTRYHQ